MSQQPMPDVTKSAVVSVVLATNRDSPYLAEAVRSVSAQTHAHWELIVVDNGVPHPEVMRETVAAVGGRVIQVPPPVTVSLARNVGVAASSGEFLVFLDDDDVWHAQRLERQLAALSALPAAPASYCGGWHMDASGAPFAPAWPASRATADEMLAGRARPPHICGAMLIRRAAFHEVGGFSPELTLMEDFELALRLLGRGTFACVPDELVGYRRHDRNATNTGIDNTRARRQTVDQILVRHSWAADVRGDVRTAGLLREHLSRERRRAANDAAGASLHAFRRGRLSEAYSELTWGLRHDARAYASATINRLTGRT